MITSLQTYRLLKQIRDLSAFSDGINDLFGKPNDDTVVDWVISDMAENIVDLLEFPEESPEYNHNNLWDLIFGLSNKTDDELSEIAVSLIEQSKQVNAGLFNG
jgi:hypothetical protein